MSAYADVVGENLIRTTNLVPDNSDYTALFWWRITENNTDGVIYYFGNDPVALYTSYILIYVVNSSGKKIKFSIGLNGVPQDLATLSAFNTNQWYRCAYVRSGTDQRFYFNGALVGTLTADISTVTDPFDNLILFDDGLADASADQQAAYFREYDRALTLDELKAEWAAPLAVDNTDLWTDTPLFANGDDVSGNNNDWSATGSISYIDRFRVVTLNEFPITSTLTPTDREDDYVFVYQGVSEDNGLIGYFAGVSTLAGNYDPFSEVYKLTSNTAESFIGALQDTQRKFSIPTEEGVPYYIRITDANFTNPPDRDLIFYFREIPINMPADVNGLIFITDDDNSIPTVSGIVDPTTGDILKNPIAIPKTENGVSSRINGNIILTGKSSPLLGNVYFYSNELVLLATDSSTLSASGQVNPPVAVTDNYFYAAQYVAGDGVIHVHRWDLDGNLDGTSWDLPLPSGWARVTNIGVAPDDSVLYYDWVRSSTPTADVVKAWDLVNDTALPDFYTADNNVRTADIIVNSQGNVFINLQNFPDDSYEVRRFSADGTLLTTYSVDSSLGFLDHIAFGTNDLVSLWIWQQLEDPADSSRHIFTFREYLIPSGSVLTTIESPDFSEDASAEVPLGDGPGDIFSGINNSCPLIILFAPSTPVTARGGIYKIVPWSAKPEDTLWVEPGSEDTFDVKIPDPTVKTGLIGD